VSVAVVFVPAGPPDERDLVAHNSKGTDGTIEDGLPLAVPRVHARFIERERRCQAEWDCPRSCRRLGPTSRWGYGIVGLKDDYVNKLIERLRRFITCRRPACCRLSVSSNDAAAPLETGGDGRAALRMGRNYSYAERAKRHGPPPLQHQPTNIPASPSVRSCRVVSSDRLHA
jgi:hypothetical protein